MAQGRAYPRTVAIWRYSAERLVRPALGLLVLGAFGCATNSSANRRPHLASNVVQTEELALTLPNGYHDATAQLRRANIVLVFAKPDSSKAFQTTITIIKAPVAGGSFADAATCAETGRGLVAGGIDAPGTGGVLKSTRVIDGPVGKACQVHLVAPEGVALITELHRSPNTPQSPKQLWLMTCNHVDGDIAAEEACRATLASFHFRSR